MLIKELLIHYVLMLRRYKQLIYIILFYSLTIFSLGYIVSLISQQTTKLLVTSLAFYLTGFFIAIFSSLTFYYFTYKISTNVFVKNLLSGFIFLFTEAFYWLLMLSGNPWISIFLVFLFYYFILVIISYNVEDNSPEKAFFDAALFIIKYPGYFFLQFLIYVFFGILYAGIYMLAYHSMGAMLVANFINSVILSLMIYLMTVIYAMHYSSYREIILREL